MEDKEQAYNWARMGFLKKCRDNYLALRGKRKLEAYFTPCTHKDKLS